MATIEHDKPLEQRTYEQRKLLNEYLLLHFGERLSGNFQYNAPTTADATPQQQQQNTYTLDLNSTAASVFNWGEFGVFNTTTGQLDPPQFPTYALNFPARVAQMALYWYKHTHPEQLSGEGLTAFDLGCAVGRTAFELTPYFSKVFGLDYSYAFIAAAQELQQGKILPFSAPVEGHIAFTSNAEITNPAVIPARCEFFQGDACALDLTQQYDCITAANLIDRLPHPTQFLSALEKIVKPGGVVVLTSPYTWLQEYTPQEEWLVSEENASTFEALLKILSPHFTSIHQSHMPFLIRETGRKSQFTLAHCTVWQRK